MRYHSYHSTVFDRWSADQVWQVVRDFNAYPSYINGVEESHIEEDLPGTAVGAVRNFRIGAARTRQRLMAHSDVDRFFTYESCEPFQLDDHGHERTMVRYRGTLRITPVTDGDRSFVEWSAKYECSADDAEYWHTWWMDAPPEWLQSLRTHLL
jgi:ribosome-associated toxin RatA of RatAB toxin-antitoxin module